MLVCFPGKARQHETQLGHTFWSRELPVVSMWNKHFRNVNTYQEGQVFVIHTSFSIALIRQHLAEWALAMKKKGWGKRKKYFSFLKINLFIYIQLQLSAFSPLPSTPPQPVPPPSPTSNLPLDFVLVSFIVAPINPSPHYPLPTPLWLLFLRMRHSEVA